uniref:Ion transport domain-containing protein n=1 Tax=Chrysotila carterae TaxID=13221 RepID=A0A7S4BLJ7_CHRCT
MLQDVYTFFLLFAAFFANYGLAMYITFPWKEGQKYIPQVPSFNNAVSALQSLVALALVGEPIDIELVDEEYNLHFPSETTGQSIDFLFFVVFYLIYIIICLVLLLNLLIAMMGNTFGTITENSTLQWRVDFARLVLKLELQVRPRLKRKGWRWRPGRTDPAVGVEGGRSSPRLSSRPLVQTQECVRSHCLKKDPSSVRIVSRIARSCNSPRALLLFLSMRHLESSRVLYI